MRKLGNDCELLWTSFKFSNCKTLHLAICYRPPNSRPEVLHQIHDSINCAFQSSTRHPHIIVGGDFNLGDIEWEPETSKATNQNTSAQHNRLLPITEDCSLTQQIKSPTRQSSGKTLDLLFSSYPNTISNMSTLSGMSDYLAVLFISKPPDHSSLPTKPMSTKGQTFLA